jgi:hypothetical protein
VKDGTAKLEIDHFSVVILLEEDRANLSDDTGSATDAGAASSGGSGASSGATLDAGSKSDDPAAQLDASRAGASSTPAITFDSAAPIFEKDAAMFPLPLPFGDAAASGGVDAGFPSGFPDAGVLFVDDAGSDAGDASSEAGLKDAGKAADAAIDAD